MIPAPHPDASRSEDLLRRAWRHQPVRRTVRLGVRTVTLPLRVAASATAVAFRAGLRVGRLPVRVTALGARRLGAVGVVTLLVGIGIGMLVAPTSGAQLRARLRTLVGGTGALPDGEVRVAVQRELSAAPRTWHLPQPEVAVHGGVVTLRGTVPHDTARLEVEAAAAGVRGVQGVVNDLVVA
jgi:hypothetical protein